MAIVKSPKKAPLEFTPLEFETLHIYGYSVRGGELEFTPLEFETTHKRRFNFHRRDLNNRSNKQQLLSCKDVSNKR